MRFSFRESVQAPGVDLVWWNPAAQALCSIGARAARGRAYRKAATVPRVLLSTRALSFCAAVPMGTPLNSLAGFDQ